MISAFIMTTETSCWLLLGRPWLRDAKVVGDYELDEYFIKDRWGNYKKTGNINTTAVSLCAPACEASTSEK